MQEDSIIYKGEFPCPYFDDGRIGTHEYVMIGMREFREFDEYLRRGYRRIGTHYYRPACKECCACRPIRLETDTFTVSRSQSRTLRKNSDVRLEVGPSYVSPEKTDLYVKYQRTKHGDPPDADDSGISLFDIHYGFNNTLEMDYYLGMKLIGVGIVDVAEDAFSANYFYYDTDVLKRRPGILSAMNEIFLAKEMGKKYYYLGFYIENNPKMSYKKSFRPNQILREGRWVQYVS